MATMATLTANTFQVFSTSKCILYNPMACNEYFCKNISKAIKQSEVLTNTLQLECSCLLHFDALTNCSSPGSMLHRVADFNLSRFEVKQNLTPLVNGSGLTESMGLENRRQMSILELESRRVESWGLIIARISSNPRTLSTASRISWELSTSGGSQ